MIKKVLAFVLLTNFSLHAETLDALGLKWGTDKSSTFHNYTGIYEKYFSAMREKPIKFLEIGFANGGSAHMWEEYFLYANLYFIDINPATVNLLQNFKRSKLYLLDQENPTELSNFIKEVEGEFDIIIDDGGHTMNQQIISFKILFPHIKSGGIYVVEDLHTSYSYYPGYGKGYGSANPKQETAVHFLQNLVHAINYPGALTTCADYNKCSPDLFTDLMHYEKDIESIHFYSSLCFIFKK